MEATIHGKKFDVAPEPADYWKWIGEGRYDHEWKIYDEHLKPEHTFVDLGAWVGAHSLYASTIAKKVIAVEPDPVAFELLTRNVMPLRIPICLAAVTGYEGELKIGSGWLGASTTRANPNAGGGIGAWDENHTCTVPCTTISKFCDNLLDPLFIKMDVEGSEEQIIEDVDFFAERKPTLLIELHPFWWVNPDEARINFERVKDLYGHADEVIKDTWVLHG